MDLKRLFASTSMGARKWAIGIALLSLAGAVSAAVVIPNLFPFLDPTGFVSTNQRFQRNLTPTEIRQLTAFSTAYSCKSNWSHGPLRPVAPGI